MIFRKNPSSEQRFIQSIKKIYKENPFSKTLFKEKGLSMENIEKLMSDEFQGHIDLCSQELKKYITTEENKKDIEENIDYFLDALLKTNLNHLPQKDRNNIKSNARDIIKKSNNYGETIDKLDNYIDGVIKKEYIHNTQLESISEEALQLNEKIKFDISKLKFSNLINLNGIRKFTLASVCFLSASSGMSSMQRLLMPLSPTSKLFFLPNADLINAIIENPYITSGAIPASVALLLKSLLTKDILNDAEQKISLGKKFNAINVFTKKPIKSLILLVSAVAAMTGIIYSSVGSAIVEKKHKDTLKTELCKGIKKCDPSNNINTQYNGELNEFVVNNVQNYNNTMISQLIKLVTNEINGNGKSKFREGFGRDAEAVAEFYLFLLNFEYSDDFKELHTNIVNTKNRGEDIKSLIEKRKVLFVKEVMDFLLQTSPELVDKINNLEEILRESIIDLKENHPDYGFFPGMINKYKQLNSANSSDYTPSLGLQMPNQKEQQKVTNILFQYINGEIKLTHTEINNLLQTVNKIKDIQFNTATDFQEKSNEALAAIIKIAKNYSNNSELSLDKTEVPIPQKFSEVEALSFSIDDIHNELEESFTYLVKEGKINNISFIIIFALLTTLTIELGIDLMLTILIITRVTKEKANKQIMQKRVLIIDQSIDNIKERLKTEFKREKIRLNHKLQEKELNNIKEKINKKLIEVNKMQYSAHTEEMIKNNNPDVVIDSCYYTMNYAQDTNEQDKEFKILSYLSLSKLQIKSNFTNANSDTALFIHNNDQSDITVYFMKDDTFSVRVNESGSDIKEDKILNKININNKDRLNFIHARGIISIDPDTYNTNNIIHNYT